MSLKKFDLGDLVRRFNLGERGITEFLLSPEETKYYNDFQVLSFLARYAVFNETISEAFMRCVEYVCSKKKSYTGIGKVPARHDMELFRYLLSNKIVFSGHRLLSYGYGNTEACLTVSFSNFPKAMKALLGCMQDQLACGLEITDPAIKKGTFDMLESLTNTYKPPRLSAVNHGSMLYRFNLIVNIASVQVLDILEAMLPSSRKSTVENLATIAILDDFLEAVKKNKEWHLYKLDRRIASSEEYRALNLEPIITVNARDLLNRICKSQLSVGKPSIIFLDSLNQKLKDRFPFFNTEGRSITTTNLCCEIALPTLPNEMATCNIAAVNLKGVKNFWEAYNRAYVLTNAMNATIMESTYSYTRSFRPLGIGSLGAFDCFVELLKENTQAEALDLMEDLFFGIYMGALHASTNLARVYGNFENFVQVDYRKYPKLVELANKAESFGLLQAFEQSFKYRYNLTLTAQAPTANMSMFCDTSPSLEPCEHECFIRVNGHFIKVSTPDCGMSLWRKSIISEELIKRFSKYCDQTISANAFIFRPELLAKLIMKRRGYCDTGMYYCRNIQSYNNILCNSCSV